MWMDFHGKNTKKGGIDKNKIMIKATIKAWQTINKMDKPYSKWLFTPLVDACTPAFDF
jgi:hypothetical protein